MCFAARSTLRIALSTMAKTDDLKGTKELMSALVRMKPKQHADMEVRKKAKKSKSKKKPGKLSRGSGGSSV
jgi:hypothetical protein